MRNHKLIRLYVPDRLSAGATINLNKDQSHYLLNVMRRKLSDSVLLFNGVDGEYETKIITDNKNSIGLMANSFIRPQHNSPDVTLLYAPVKTVKNEFIIQKATELGVKKIQPVNTERTIKDKTNSEKLKLVAIEAAEQCERLDIPVVAEIQDLKKVVVDYSGHMLMICDETGKGQSVSVALHNQDIRKPWAVLTGPEGGFSENELKLFSDMKNIVRVGLGPRIMRAETAIITAVALWQNYLGDFNISPEFRE